MNFIKQNIAYIAVAVAVLAIGVFAILPVLPSTDQAEGTFISAVMAFGVPDTGAGDSGGDCCDSGGSGGNSSGSGFGVPDTGTGDSGGDCCGESRPTTGSTPTKNPNSTELHPQPAVCSYLKVNGKTGGANQTVPVPYGTENVTLTYQTVRANIVKLNGTELVKKNNISGKTVKISGDTKFRLVAKNAQGTGACVVNVNVMRPAACEAFKVNGKNNVSLNKKAGTVRLTWETVRAPKDVRIKNLSTGKVTDVVHNTNLQGRDFEVKEDTTFQLIVISEDGTRDTSCAVGVDVKDTPTPVAKCLTFVAKPTKLGENGGTTNLKWTTKNAESVKIKNVTTGDVYNVAKNNSNNGRNFNITDKTSFQLLVTGVDNNVDRHCEQTITVGTTEDKLTCSDVTFTASDTSVREGSNVNLNWSVSSDVDDVSIDHGIGDVNRNDSTTVRIDDDITYHITIKNADSEKTCPLSINAESGGGGGGSSSPRCDLDISDDKIKLGDTVTLKWDTSRTNEISITDDEGNIIIESDDKDDMDGDIKVKPTQDTEYTLRAEKGSKHRTCKVDVKVEKGGVTVLETRTQEPRVAGISLTTVPYTGFEAGPALTMLFYALLTLWALYVAYVLVIKRDSLGGVSFAGAHTHAKYDDVSVDEGNGINEVQEYVASETAATIPHNLPTATAPVVGYAATTEAEEVTEEVESEFTALEEVAHQKRVLLSTDAMRYIASTHGTGEAAVESLNKIIDQAKVSFPSEDGWVVLNLSRVESLVGELNDEKLEAVAEVAAPAATGSLAEAIVSGNIVAAYELIDNRPMVALAAAAADLDALYRARKGEETNVSGLLKTEAANIANEKIEAAIAALTGALDGTYSSEAEAVKMAILKAVKAIA